MVDVDPCDIDSQGEQTLALNSEVLLIGGAACIADAAPSWRASSHGPATDGRGLHRQRTEARRHQWTPALAPGGAARFARLPDHRMLVILVTMSETRSLAEAKAHLSELVARAGTEHERITVTVHGRPTAVLLALEDLEALEETIAVLSDPALMHSLSEADAELARGEGEDQESLAAVMRARRATA